MRLPSAVFAITACTLVAVEASAEPDPAYSRAYRDAVAYLRAHGGEAFADDPAQGVILPEAVAADPLVAGPRSGSVLASLELASVDAHARRRRVLTALGLDASADTASLLDEICCEPDGSIRSRLLPGQIVVVTSGRPRPMWWQNNGAAGLYRDTGAFGAVDTRIPNALDRALALQAFHDSPSDDPVTFAKVADSIIFLLEYRIDQAPGVLWPQVPRVSWPLVRDGEAGGSGPTSDLAV